MTTATTRKIIPRLANQVAQVRSGGLRVVLRKSYIIFALTAAFPVVLLARMLRPLIVIRFGHIRSDRIGHFAPEIELYLCERDAGMYGTRALDIFYHVAPACNRQLKTMFDRILNVSPLARWPDRLNRILPGGWRNVIPRRTKWPQYDVYGLTRQTQPHLSFTHAEESMGRQSLDDMGIPPEAPFVCFIARDAAYLEAKVPETDWGYSNHRNSNIFSYMPVLEELASRGYYSVRMGAEVTEPLNSANPKIKDYATTCRSEFLDIFLSAKCRFFISSGTGIDSIAMVFRRPLVFVNFIPLHEVWTWDENYLVIPKKLWLRGEGRFMTLREVLESDVANIALAQEYERLGIEPVENSPQEIMEVVLEMDGRLNGNWQTTDQDEELQRQFWSSFGPQFLHGPRLSRVGAEFLRQNQEMLN